MVMDRVGLRMDIVQLWTGYLLLGKGFTVRAIYGYGKVTLIDKLKLGASYVIDRL